MVRSITRAWLFSAILIGTMTPVQAANSSPDDPVLIGGSTGGSWRPEYQFAGRSIMDLRLPSVRLDTAPEPFSAARDVRLSQMIKLYHSFAFDQLEQAVRRHFRADKLVVSADADPVDKALALAFSVLLADAAGDLGIARSRLHELFRFAPGFPFSEPPLNTIIPPSWQQEWKSLQARLPTAQPHHTNLLLYQNGFRRPLPEAHETIEGLIDLRTESGDWLHLWLNEAKEWATFYRSAQLLEMSRWRVELIPGGIDNLVRPFEEDAIIILQRDSDGRECWLRTTRGASLAPCETLFPPAASAASVPALVPSLVTDKPPSPPATVPPGTIPLLTLSQPITTITPDHLLPSAASLAAASAPPVVLPSNHKKALWVSGGLGLAVATALSGWLYWQTQRPSRILFMPPVSPVSGNQ